MEEKELIEEEEIEVQGEIAAISLSFVVRITLIEIIKLWGTTKSMEVVGNYVNNIF